VNQTKSKQTEDFLVVPAIPETSQNSSGGIVGGSIASLGQFPYQVSLETLELCCVAVVNICLTFIQSKTRTYRIFKRTFAVER
jgi:hypothetical protein